MGGMVEVKILGVNAIGGAERSFVGKSKDGS